MTMEEALVTRLAGATGVSALLGNGEEGLPSVGWFGRVRTDALPALALIKVSPGREWSHSGPDGLDGPRIQFDCYARTTPEAMALALAVRTEMESAATVSGIVFHEAQLESENWIDEGEQDGGSPLFRISQDYTFYHEEIAP